MLWEMAGINANGLRVDVSKEHNVLMAVLHESTLTSQKSLSKRA